MSRGGCRVLRRRLPLFCWALAPALRVGQADLLTFIEDGQTTREQVFLALGEPSATYDDARILTFRLGRDDGGYFLLEKAPGFRSVKYSLVLAFDDAGLLRRHSLVAVKAP